MSLQDPISNMLTVIRNGLMAKHESVVTPHSVMKEKILDVLIEEGYLLGYEVEEANNIKKINIKLKYYQGKPVIQMIKRCSKPSLRHYSSADDIPMVLDGMGVTVVSTNQGILPDYKAKQLNVGGEIICQVE